MRKITFGVACSLDGFIAREDHSTDWLFWSADVDDFTRRFWKTIDVVLMGRNTYDVAVRGGTTSCPGVRNRVFSRRPVRIADPAVELVAGDAAAFVTDLKRRQGEGICVMGGGRLANSLFEAGLIDEVGLNIHPVLLGSGIPLFREMKSQVDLELIECRTIEGGCLLASYRVKKRGGRRRAAGGTRR